MPRKQIWPFTAGAALAASLLILVAIVTALAVLRRTIDWPASASEAVTRALIVSLVPLILLVLDVVVERGGALEAVGIKFNFSQVVTPSLGGLAIRTNISGTIGQPIGDSDTVTILDSLKEASSHDVVIIDLGRGTDWWETRLLVLLAGAVRMRRPSVVIFVAADTVDGTFQGWALPEDLLPLLLRTDRRYQESYGAASAAASQWALVMPNDYPLNGFSGLASRYEWMRHDTTGGRNELAAEQVLAADLGTTIEHTSGSKAITVAGLQQLFRNVLHTDAIDETSPSDQQLGAFLKNAEPYIAATHRGQYLRLIPQANGLNAILRSICDAWPSKTS